MEAGSSFEGCGASHCVSNYSPSPIACLNHTVVHKNMTDTELYLTLSKYVGELLLVKSFTLRQSSNHPNQQSSQYAANPIGNHHNYKPTQSAAISISNHFNQELSQATANAIKSQPNY